MHVTRTIQSYNSQTLILANSQTRSFPSPKSCHGNLNVPQTYNGKSENWHLLLSQYRYFDRSFKEMFLVQSSTKHHFSPKHLNLIGCHGNRKIKSYEKVFKPEDQRSCNAYLRPKLELIPISKLFSCQRLWHFCEKLKVIQGSPFWSFGSRKENL